MESTPFADLAQLAARLEATKGRRELSSLLATFLASLAPAEVPPAVRLIIGQVFPEWDERSLNLSWRSVMAVVEDLTDVPPTLLEELSATAVDGGQLIRSMLQQARRHPPSQPSLSILQVYETLEEVAASTGRGSRSRKAGLVQELLQRASPEEAAIIAKVVFQDMRHGVNEGIMLEGIALAAGVKTRWVRRANQLWGDIGLVALTAVTEGEAALRNATVKLFRPIKPMLAQAAESLDDAHARYQDRFALEYKMDGARVQIHRDGDQVRIYSRNLADVSASLPEVVDEVRAGLRPANAILDGEVIAIDSVGLPLPFQHLMRRFGRKRGVAQALDEIPVRLYLFDILYADGHSLIGQTALRRRAALEQAAGPIRLVPYLAQPVPAQAKAFSIAACEAGHEGVMAKDLDSTYGPGARGKAWLKIKHVSSLDLVIVAADWGYGRRHGWLSNYHLAARDRETGGYEIVGKTFKGPTDAEFQELTRRLLEAERSRQAATVFVQPAIVVEVLFNEIQVSSQYPSGLALRFARISRIRDDKRPADADTVLTLRQMLEEQFRFKGRLP